MPADRPGGGPAPRRWLIGAVALALAFRLVLVALLHDSPSFAGVTLNYGETARHLALGHGFAQGSITEMQKVVEAEGRLLDPETFRDHPDAKAWKPTMYRLPGYSLLLAGTFRVFGRERYVYLQVLQAVVDAVAGTLLVFWLGATVFTPVAGVVAGFLYALSPIARIAVYPLPDAWMSVFILASAALALRFLRTGRARWAVLLGLDLGVAAYFRLEAGILLLPAYALAVAAGSGSVRRGAALLFLGGLVVLVVMAPWALRNRRAFGTLRPGPVQAGGLLWEGIGEFPNPIGAKPSDRALYEHQAARGFEPKTPEADRFILSEVKTFVRGHPGEFAWMVLRRGARTLVLQGGRWEVPGGGSPLPALAREPARAVPHLLLTLVRIASFLAVAAGLWSSRASWRTLLVLLAAPLAFILPQWLVIVEARHVLIATGPAAVLAAPALLRLLRPSRAEAVR